MAKTIKIDDVKQPGRVLPSATSRPILVTDHTDTPTADPMLASPGSDADKKDESPAEPATLNHTAKNIEPLTAPTVKPAAAVEPTSTLLAATPEPKPAEDSNPSETSEDTSKAASEPAPETPVATITTSDSAAAKATPTESSSESSSDDDADGKTVLRDPAAAISAEEAAAAEAKAKREQELEDVIASGKYAVPVNAVQRKRSRMHIMLLCIVAILLLLALLDAVFDVGTVNAPQGIPHTHLFSKS